MVNVGKYTMHGSYGYILTKSVPNRIATQKQKVVGENICPKYHSNKLYKVTYGNYAEFTGTLPDSICPC